MTGVTLEAGSGSVMLRIGDDGIAEIVWDLPGRSVNVLNPESLAAFAAAVDRVLGDPAIRGAIVTSAKSGFIAGADHAWLSALAAGATAPELLETVMGVQTLFRRIEKASKPFVAALNGTARAGGFELALACHYRIGVDDANAQVGLPEATVGLMPGAGGSQRYLRMLGVMAAMPLLLEGRLLAPGDALKAGLIDAAVPPGELLAAARRWIGAAKPDALVKRWDKPGFVPPGVDPRTAQGANAFAAAHALQRKRSQGNYPALDAIQQVVYQGWVVPLDVALKLEAKYFVKILRTPVARAMMRTHFISLPRANKLARRPVDVAERGIAKIGVLGAGMMGAGIAHVTAAAGIAVVLIDRDQALAARGKDHTQRQCQAAVEKRRLTPAEADRVLGRITPTADYAALAGCDLVIEAVFEDRALKADVTGQAEAVLGADAVFASNTSTLPISGLAAAARRPERFIGLHFFSPVERMPLVEIIRGRQTGAAALARAMDFVRRIGKTPIVVNDTRGFYTSRVFATYIDEGVLMLAAGIAPALIENAGRSAGMPVAPLALCDEVSLELIHKVNRQTAVDLGPAFRETAATRLIARMVEREGRIGKRAGRGFYDYPAEGRKRLWPDLAGLAGARVPSPPIADLKERLLAIQALEAARCVEEGVIEDAGDADIGAVLGWGFAPWTGGPLSYIDMVGPAAFVAACERLAARHGERFVPSAWLKARGEQGDLFHPMIATKAS